MEIIFVLIYYRTSRVDQLECTENRVHPVRPSSLPYRPVSSAQGMKGSKLTPPRRAVSSSVSRRPQQQNKTPKYVPHSILICFYNCHPNITTHFILS